MRTSILLGASMAATLLTATAAFAQIPAGIQLNPGERLISVNGQPYTGSGQAAATATTIPTTAPGSYGQVVQASATAPVPTASNISGNLVRSGLPFSHSPGSTALDKANHERQRNGQRALLPDPALQQLALQKATIAAQRSYKNHIGGSLGGAKCEGVGYTQGRFLTCCLDTPGTYGGAAMVQGSDGWYCCLLVR